MHSPTLDLEYTFKTREITVDFHPRRHTEYFQLLRQNKERKLYVPLGGFASVAFNPEPLRMIEAGSICPLDGRYRSSTNELRKVWGDCHLMRHRVHVELKWLEFFLNRVHPHGPLTDSQLQELLPLYEFTEVELEKIAAFEKQVNHDVKAVEYYLKERLSSVSSLKGFSDFVHILCTSEDINNLAYGLMVHQTLHKVLVPNMQQIAQELQRLAKQHADDGLLARTHGQPATPTTFGKEFAVYAHRLNKHIQKISALKPLGKFSGAVGNFNAHLIAFPDKDWPALARDFVESLGLQYQPLSTQIECHDWISELCDDVARFNTTLLGLCVDCWTYISRQHKTLNPKLLKSYFLRLGLLKALVRPCAN